MQSDQVVRNSQNQTPRSLNEKKTSMKTAGKKNGRAWEKHRNLLMNSPKSQKCTSNSHFDMINASIFYL